MLQPDRTVASDAAELTQPLNELGEIVRLVDKVTFDLADKVPSKMVAQLIVIAADLDRTIKDVAGYKARMAKR